MNRSLTKGVIREVAKRVFKLDVKLTLVGRNQRTVQMTTGERQEEHVIFCIHLADVSDCGERSFATKLPLQKDGKFPTEKMERSRRRKERHKSLQVNDELLAKKMSTIEKSVRSERSALSSYLHIL